MKLIKLFLGGCLLLSLVVFAFSCGLVGLLAVGKNANDAAKAEKKEAITSLELTENRYERSGNYINYYGKITNKGASGVKFIKVEIEALDKQKNIIDSEVTFAIGGDELRSGSSRTYHGMMRFDKRMASFTAAILPD